jgi:hypothetical protein
MERCIRGEWLDELPADDPRALGSRRDLRRLNAWMGNTRLMAQALHAAFPKRPALLTLELGAGDGAFFLRVARRLGAGWRGAGALLLDRTRSIEPATLEAFARLGWRAAPAQADVFDWFRRPDNVPCEAVIANLFLHHFSEAQLTELLLEAARHAQAFIAIEPRRSAQALFFSRCVGLIGCNEVTRHDAPASVQAGFSGNELSRLWPVRENWILHEQRAGWFSHLFVARQGAAQREA